MWSCSILYVCIDGYGGQEIVNLYFVLFVSRRQQGVLVMSREVELVGGLDITG